MNVWDPTAPRAGCERSTKTTNLAGDVVNNTLPTTHAIEVLSVGRCTWQPSLSGQDSRRVQSSGLVLFSAHSVGDGANARRTLTVVGRVLRLSEIPGRSLMTYLVLKRVKSSPLLAPCTFFRMFEYHYVVISRNCFCTAICYYMKLYSLNNLDTDNTRA